MIEIARALGLEIVGSDDEFGIWVNCESGCHPLIDDPKYKARA